MEAKSTLLFVDDEPFVLETLNRLFQSEGYNLRFADSAAHALELLQKEPVQLIVSDFRMPGMNGGELLKAVSEQWPDTVRIILSAYADVTSVVTAINDGQIYKFISKPWSNEELRVIIREGVERYWQQMNLRSLAEAAVAENQALMAVHFDGLERLHQRHATMARQEEMLELRSTVFDMLLTPLLVFCDGELADANDAARTMLDPTAQSVNDLAIHEVVRGLPDHFGNGVIRKTFNLQVAGQTVGVDLLTTEEPDCGTIVVAALKQS